MLASSLRRGLAPVLSSRTGLAVIQTERLHLSLRLGSQLSRPLTGSAKSNSPSDLASIVERSPRAHPRSTADSYASPSYHDAHASIQGWVGTAILPKSLAPKKKSPEERWREMSASIMAKAVQANDAYAGRSVPRPHGDTVANAYRKLSSIISRNNVRKELRMAERHEKKGPKRRRLSSERWRRRFAHEVRKKVQLVQAIRTRGG